MKKKTKKKVVKKMLNKYDRSADTNKPAYTGVRKLIADEIFKSRKVINRFLSDRFDINKEEKEQNEPKKS